MRWTLLVLAALMPPGALAQTEGAAPATQAEAEAPPAPPVAGRVELVEGDVRFIDAAGGERRPQIEDPILEGESVHTGGDGEVHLRMEDGGFVAVRPGTRFSITEFRAEGQASDRMTLGLLEGAIRAVSGWIARYNRANYQVRTPFATIGIRGTDHEPLVIPEGSPLGEPGTYDKVNQGATFIETPQGRVEVEPGRTAFAPWRRAERPRLLERTPGFFRGGRHEARISERYPRIQQQLEERRELRRQRFEQRRAERQQRLERQRSRPEAGPRGRELREERRRAREQRPQSLEERRGARDARSPERRERIERRPGGERERPQRSRER